MVPEELITSFGNQRQTQSPKWILVELYTRGIKSRQGGRYLSSELSSPACWPHMRSHSEALEIERRESGFEKMKVFMDNGEYSRSGGLILHNEILYFYAIFISKKFNSNHLILSEQPQRERIGEKYFYFQFRESKVETRRDWLASGINIKRI